MCVLVEVANSVFVCLVFDIYSRLRLKSKIEGLVVFVSDYTCGSIPVKDVFIVSPARMQCFLHQSSPFEYQPVNFQLSVIYQNSSSMGFEAGVAKRDDNNVFSLLVSYLKLILSPVKHRRY